jgi:NADPH-dependent glutamate synthase beta subunit-like oxidoreductase
MLTPEWTRPASNAGEEETERNSVHYYKYLPSKPKGQRDKTIAVIGACPAGLACAYYLAFEGYRITILRRFPKGSPAA